MRTTLRIEKGTHGKERPVGELGMTIDYGVVCYISSNTSLRLHLFFVFSRAWFPRLRGDLVRETPIKCNLVSKFVTTVANAVLQQN